MNKKILIVSEYYHPFIKGGAETTIKAYAEKLVKDGNKVTVLTPNYETNDKIREKIGGVEVIRFKSLRRLLYKSKKRKDITKEAYANKKRLFYLFLSFYTVFSACDMRNATKRLMKKKHFDEIGGNNLESVLAVAGIKTKSRKVVYLRDFGLFCHNRGLYQCDWFCELCGLRNFLSAGDLKGIVKWMFGLTKKLENSQLNKFNHIVAASEFIRNRTSDITKVKKEDIEIIYDIIAPEYIAEVSKKEAREKLKLPLNKKIFLYLGTLSPLKGAQFIVPLSKRFEEIYFVVVGGGPLKDEISKNQGQNLRYDGFVETTEIKYYYKSADVLLVPSVWYEPFGRVVAEGFANGCFVIGSNYGGIGEQIKKSKKGIATTPTLEGLENSIENYLKKS